MGVLIEVRKTTKPTRKLVPAPETSVIGPIPPAASQVGGEPSLFVFIYITRR